MNDFKPIAAVSDVRCTRVTVVGPSRGTRGGVTGVILCQCKGEVWSRWRCRWIESTHDRSAWAKVAYFFAAVASFVAALPRTRIVHIHLSERTSALRKTPFLLLARLFGCRTIVHFHAFSAETTVKSRWKWLYRFLFTACDCLIVLSDSWARAIRESGITPRRMVVVHNPCRMGLEAGLPDPVLKRARVILFAGSLIARKGYADLIQAFARVAADFESWTLAFAGVGETEAAQRRADALGISGRVRFLGWLDEVALGRALTDAQVFCLPSYAEGFPMAVLDAWAAGLAVVCTPVGGLPDMARDGENALLVPCGDIDALSEALRRLLGDAALRERLSLQGRTLAAGRFSIEAFSAALDGIYRTVDKPDTQELGVEATV